MYVVQQLFKETYLRNVFWSFTVDVNKLLKVLRTFEEDDSTSEKTVQLILLLISAWLDFRLRQRLKI